MARLATDTTLREQWGEYQEQGLTVFPLKKGGKNPGTDFGIKWQEDWVTQRRPTFPSLADTFETGTYGLWLATGQVSKRVVLDLDRPEAEDYWREKLGEVVFNTALKVNTGRGKHLHFRLREDDDRPWPGHSDNEVGYDFRGDGGGVVLPPSVHKSGTVYAWAGGELQDAPDCLRKAERPVNREGSTTTANTLADELMLPPGDPGRGNNWLTRVAGFEAKAERRFYDRYLARMINYNWASSDPIEEGAFMKTIESIWRSEQSKRDQGLHDPDTGWLVGDGERISTLCIRTKNQGENQGERYVVVDHWADFDIKVRGVTTGTNSRMTYIVDLHTDSGVKENLELDPALFGQEARVASWLAMFGGTILPPEGDAHSSAPARIRLLRYIKSQEAKMSKTTDHLGWHPNIGFITHNGVFSADGIRTLDGITPARDLVDQVSYKYGLTSNQSVAIEVLKEVLTFQDETTTSVFGSWWCMALLKGQFPCSLFPFMSIEAPSESGKTTGFFAMMVALAGNATGHGQSTFAAQRDVIAGHRNGIAWIDDMTDPAKIQDLIRQATSEGTISLRNTEKGGNIERTLRSPVFVSGEGAGSMMAEKAMRDRAVRLQVSSPKGRMSLHNPDRPQWDDVLSLMARFGGDTKGLTAVAGSILVEVLRCATLLPMMPELRPSAGRHGDKMGIIRMGARVLAAVTGDDAHVARVDAWVNGDEQADEGNVNTALREIIPWALNNHNVPVSAAGMVPAYYDIRTACVMVHVQTLSSEWLGRNHLSDRQRQFGAENEIVSELENNGVTGDGKNRNVAERGSGKKVLRRYRMIPATLSAKIIEWSGNEVPTGAKED